jgi:ribosomal protein S18
MRRAKKSCPITEAGIRFVDYKKARYLALLPYTRGAQT